MQQLRESKYFFPSPVSTNRTINAIVVEKTDDQTKYGLCCYSPDLIESTMILPTKYWNKFEIGDWIRCVMKEGRGQKQKETDIVMAEKIEESDPDQLNIPPTRISNGLVQIRAKFVVCPQFIKNASIATESDSYHKLVILNMGQGFYSSKNTNLPNEFNSDHVYFGVFEYRGKGDGCVKFSKNSEKDKNGVEMEKETHWELLEIVKKRATDGQKVTHIPIKNDEQMDNHLNQLKKMAKQSSDMRNRMNDGEGTSQMSANNGQQQPTGNNMEGPVFPFDPAVDDFRKLLMIDNNANPFIRRSITHQTVNP